jgi:D-aminoacyl-tRNA deacylase
VPGPAARVGVVVSEADEASVHIGERLLAARDWTTATDERRDPDEGGGTVHRQGPFELRTFADLHLHLDGVAAAFDDPDLVVFASRHSGETGPLLTAHFTGNLGPAEYGGADHAVAEAAPAALGRVVAAFDEHVPGGYGVGVECTHHGPTDVGAPSLFVELGSGPEQWADDRAADAVAESILALADLAGGETLPSSGRTLVGVGGGHYAPRFERVLRETDWTVGHVAADWGLDAMGDPAEHRDLLAALFAASGAEYALLDGDYPDVAAVIEDLGHRVVSETWVRESDGVALELVERLEADLGPVAAGLRFGAPAVEFDGPADPAADDGPTLVDLPDELLGEALGVDADAARAAVEATCLAYQTGESGTRPGGRAAVADPADRAALVERLADVLAADYDAVAVREDAVVAEEEAFDPALAREAGVDPGPKFGRLADGEPVEGDDGTVAPAEVHRERTHRFDV